jgi:hypothetical protein
VRDNASHSAGSEVLTDWHHLVTPLVAGQLWQKAKSQNAKSSRILVSSGVMGGAFGARCVYRLGNAQSADHSDRYFERRLSRICVCLFGSRQTMNKVGETGPLTRWEWFVYTPIVLSMVAGSAILFAQSVLWLKTSKWYWIKLHEVGIHSPLDATGDKALDKILAWLLHDTPLFVWLVLIIPLMWRILTAVTESVLPNR